MAISCHRLWVAAGFLLVCAVLLTTSKAANTGPQWLSDARGAGLDDNDVEQLIRDKILVTNQTYKQVFTPYLGSRLPLFVTSDSLLNAYHVLYEESIQRLEQANAKKLPDILRFILENLNGVEERVPGEPQLLPGAKRRAVIVVGTALRLLDPGYEPADESVRSIIEEEVDRIVTAKAELKPAWLGPAESDFMALDYDRYKVRGFYTQSETLTRHFRAVAWLQSIPFRVAKDEELLSILMLGNCIAPGRFGGNDAKYREYRDFFSTYKVLIGSGDDWDLVTAADYINRDGKIHLDEVRRQLLKEAADDGNRPQVNDQVRFAPENAKVTSEANFRIISACRTPDAVLFQRTTDVRQFQHRIAPNGLEVCVALGSAFARDRIEDVEKAKLLLAIEKAKPLLQSNSLYSDYMTAVAALLDAPDPKAPAFMKGEAWQAKSCGTALGAWAQLRHTWILQAKSNAFYACASTPPKGFVEPEPDFYRRMSDLAAKTREVLRSAHIFDAGYSEAINALTESADLLERLENEPDIQKKIPSLQDDTSDGPMRILSFVLCFQEDNQARLRRIHRAAESLKTGTVDPSFAHILTTAYGLDLESHWRSLEQTSQRLESVAQKQLVGVALNKEEEAFLGRYGATLAVIMLYGGNSFYTPRDDAPKVADVFWHYRAGNLHVGIGRPRALYVLYPWKGKEVLCAGAVLPYYEFFNQERLTDSEWRSMLDSKTTPDLPGWLRPIICRDGLSAPDVR